MVPGAILSTDDYIRSTHRRNIFALLYALMSRKTEDLYVKLSEMLKVLQFIPTSAMVDFEEARVSAFRRVFPICRADISTASEVTTLWWDRHGYYYYYYYYKRCLIFTRSANADCTACRVRNVKHASFLLASVRLGPNFTGTGSSLY